MPKKPDAFISRLVKNIHASGSDPLTPLVDEYFMRRDRSPNRLRHYPIDAEERVRPSGRFSPSAICGCPRQAALKFTGVKGRRRIDPETLAIFDHGDWVHHKWQHRVEDMQLVLGEDKIKVISREAKVKIPELYIAGNSDNVLQVRGDRFVVDYKSINDNGFTWVFRHDEPKAEHVRQLLTYCRAHGITRGLLVYENKNDQRTKVFIVEWDQLIITEVEDWTSDLILMLDKEELPPMSPECSHGNFLWEKCQYSYLCYGSVPEEEILRTMYGKGWRGVRSAWMRGNRAVRKQEAKNATR